MRKQEPFHFSRNIFVLQCKSTMNLCRDLYEEQEGLTVVSLRQYEGRGRKGNEWVSHPGGLYFSFLLKPIFHPRRNELLYQLITKSVEYVIQSYLPAKRIEFKIPNDVMIDGKKISGVLIDSKIEGSKNIFLVVGIGINIHNSVPEIATSIEKEGLQGIAPLEVLLKFQNQFEKDYNLWLVNH
jgi:BirA family biotin operon repressor/biotin-[acetyl-CoA-carboxylase] ligase